METGNCHVGHGSIGLGFQVWHHVNNGHDVERPAKPCFNCDAVRLQVARMQEVKKGTEQEGF